MENVLFRIDDPNATDGRVEFYKVSLYFENIEGQRFNVVLETRGWWNNETAKADIDADYTPPIERFLSFERAVDRYCALRILRARTGFVHSFAWHPVTGIPVHQGRIELSECPMPEPSSNFE